MVQVPTFLTRLRAILLHGVSRSLEASFLISVQMIFILARIIRRELREGAWTWRIGQATGTARLRVVEYDLFAPLC